MCSMHDLVHDLACSVLRSSGKADGRSRARYMILRHESSPLDRREMKYCRTLITAPEISGIDFSHFESLHVLILAGSRIRELPSSIKKLIHLRNLNISSTSIKSLPDWIGEFHYLQVLRAMTKRMKKVPSTIKYLTNIRHLYLDQDTILPAGIGGLTCLQTLRYFGVGDGNDGCKIEELGGLNNLKGKLEIHNLERVCGKQEAAKANLFRKSKIMELDLIWNGSREGEIENDENVLEGLEPHADLNRLFILGFKSKRFPAWMMKMTVQNVPAGGSWLGLNKLIEIELGWCTECEEIPMLGHLPNLKSLNFQVLSNVKCINSSASTHNIVFPALETLVLHGMPKLAHVVSDYGSDVQVLPRLQFLWISGCEQLTSVGTHSLPCLKYLRIGSRSSSTPVPNIFHIKFNNNELLTELFIVNLSNLERLPDWFFNENPNLTKLEISGCPKLRELPPGLLALSSSLKELTVAGCPLLERITGGDGGEESQSVESSFFFTSLRKITIELCDALVWLPCGLVGPSLEELWLDSLSNLENLPNLMDDCTARSSRLNTLAVVSVPKFMGTSVWHFGSLRKLVINASDVEDGILQGCLHSLKELTMIGTGDCDHRPPEAIQRLTALYNLSLYSFGMEELPEWFGNLSSLMSLGIRDCKRLRRLPSIDAMTRLQGLKSLHISGCPELLAQGVADPEWRKLSHLFSVIVDGTRLNADSDTSRESRWRKLKCLD